MEETITFHLFLSIVSESASPEKFLLSKEAGHSYHQQGIDQSSDHTPER